MKNVAKKRILIKLGGSALDHSSTLKELAKLVVGYQDRNFDVVIVHGGGPAINNELNSRGITWKFIEGQRQTTPEMMTVIEKVLASDVNQKVVASLRSNGLSSVGLSGACDQILLCAPSANIELMRVGSVDQVNTHAIDIVLRYSMTNVVPVISPIGIGNFGDKFNINADYAATQIAIALKAEKLVFLTDQTGILNEEKKPIQAAAPRTLEGMILQGIISGGMATKVRAMNQAIAKGVKQVQVLHASNASLLLEDESIGTTIKVASLARERTRSRRKEVLHERAG